MIGPVPAGVDPEEYDRARRRVLWSMPQGLYVVGSRAGGDRNLMTCNWVMQVATDPKLVAVGLDATSVTARLVRLGGGFAVSLVDRADRAVVRRFVKPVTDVVLDGAGRVVAMAGVPVTELASGRAILRRHAGWLDCEVRNRVALGSHDLVVGEIVAVGEAGGAADAGGAGIEGVLRMEDTRMSYGG